MTYKIDYIYKVDGFYDIINYYKSTTPMNTTSMPAPAATGLSALSYIDNDIGQTGKYYVRFSTVRNSEEKFSNETIVLAGKFQTFFNTDMNVIVDLCDNNAWQNTETVTISSDFITFGSSSLRNTSKTVNFNSDFHLHFFHQIISLGSFNFTSLYRSFISLPEGTNTIIFCYTGNGWVNSSANTGANSKNRYALILFNNFSKSYCSLSDIVPGVEYEIDLIRKNNNFYLYINKVLQFTVPASFFGSVIATSEMYFYGGVAGNKMRDIWVKTDSSDIVLPT